jgi:hypothetical protein
MANRKISDLTALTAPATGDLLPIVDISEAAAADKNKKITFGELFASIPLGTAAAPSVAFEGDSNTGIYSPGADQLAISTNGTSRIVVDASGNVNIDSNTFYVDAANNRVGIGTTSPLRQFHVNSKVYFDTNGDGTTTIPSIAIGSESVGLSYIGGGHLALLAGSTERARIDSSGRLLVGTSTARSNFYNSTNSPQFQLEGNDNSKAALSIIQDFNANTQGAQLVLAKNNSTTVGSNVLVVSGDTLGSVSFQGNDGTEFVEGASITAVVDGTSGANDLPTRLVFYTTADGAAGPAERMRISNIGDSSMFGTLSVLRLHTETTAGTAQILLQGRYGATSGSVASGTASVLIYTNGNVQNTNNSYGAISDIKLKENIVDAASQWSDIKALQVRKYNFKEGQTHTQIGLVAQEVELISPGLVSESPDRDEEGNDLGTVTKSVNYSVLYMKAVKALQEAMERIEALEANVALLKGE